MLQLALNDMDYHLQEFLAIESDIVVEESVRLYFRLQQPSFHLWVVQYFLIVLEPPGGGRRNANLPIVQCDAVPNLLEELEAIAGAKCAALHVNFALVKEATQKGLFGLSIGVLREFPGHDVAPELRVSLVKPVAVWSEVTEAVAGRDDTVGEMIVVRHDGVHRSSRRGLECVDCQQDVAVCGGGYVGEERDGKGNWTSKHEMIAPPVVQGESSVCCG